MKTDYYPFGMVMPDRHFAVGDGYRYGFNGKESDKEVSGDANQYDYGFRIYNPRIGRFLSLDPLQFKFPSLTPYQFSSNSPIANVDLDGREALYYTKTIRNIYTSQEMPNGEIKYSYEQKIDNDMQKASLLFGQANGPLGSGTSYLIYTQTEYVHISANGNVETCIEPRKLEKGFYKYSQADEMKMDVNKRPMMNGKYQILVYGEGADNTESPGSKPNPNAQTEYFDIKAWNDMVEPILVGLKIHPAEYEPPTLEEMISTNIEGIKRKAEKAEDLKNNFIGSGEYTPSSTRCIFAPQGQHAAHPEEIDAIISDRNGHAIDTLRKNTSTGKIDTISVKP